MFKILFEQKHTTYGTRNNPISYVENVHTPTSNDGISTLCTTVPCELRAPEDFPKCRYNLLDTSATRVVDYRLKSQESSQ